MRNSRSLEMETWHDLANVYTNLSQWRDAEVCLMKSEGINPHSASRCHSTGITCLIHLFWLIFLTFLIRFILEFSRYGVEVKPNCVFFPQRDTYRYKRIGIMSSCVIVVIQSTC